MRDPFTWSLPLGSIFGIRVRVHVLFPLVAVGLILRWSFKEGTPPGMWLPATLLIGLLFVSVLLHEFGHCFGARLVEGDAHEVLLWPLGGLAAIEVPHTAKANFMAAAAGPLVNVILCVAAGIGLTVLGVRPPFNPFWIPITYDASGWIGCADLFTWEGMSLGLVSHPWINLLARFFYVNWVLLLFNLVLVGFPMDMGRMFQALLWPRLGFHRSMLWAIFAGFLTALVLGIVALGNNEVVFLFLALFIYVTCRQQWFILEHGGEDAPFGYDFSQGYTSLERDQPVPRKRQSWWRRWLQARAKKKLERELERRETEERRMDELLEKVQREGLQALTDEERRFLTRVSARYRNRQ